MLLTLCNHEAPLGKPLALSILSTADSRLGLARRTEKRASLAHQTLDRSAATVRTRSPVLAVDQMAAFELALPAVRREKIADARPAASDGLVKNLSRHLKQLFDLLDRQSAG